LGLRCKPLAQACFMLPVTVGSPMHLMQDLHHWGRPDGAAHQPSEASSAASAALPTTTPTMHAVPQVPPLPRPPPAAAAPSALTSAAPQNPKPAGPSGATSLGVQRNGVVQPSTSGAGPASGEQSEPGRPSAAPPPARIAGSALRLKPPGAGAHSSGSVCEALRQRVGRGEVDAAAQQLVPAQGFPQPRQRCRRLLCRFVTAQCKR